MEFETSTKRLGKVFYKGRYYFKGLTVLKCVLRIFSTSIFTSRATLYNCRICFVYALQNVVGVYKDLFQTHDLLRLLVNYEGLNKLVNYQVLAAVLMVKPKK